MDVIVILTILESRLSRVEADLCNPEYLNRPFRLWSSRRDAEARSRPPAC